MSAAGLFPENIKDIRGRARQHLTRVLLERILAQEVEHANDMHDLLVSHQGRPMLDK